jgi:hypothetical protein
VSGLLGAALAYAACGLHVFPCRPQRKTPATAHGCKDATVDPEKISRWWAACPDFNIAIATGSASGLFVADIDGLDAEAALRKLEDQHGALPPTWEAITPNGRHLGFACPDRKVSNSASRIAPGIDVRGEGGFVVVPPSIHPCGKPYAWSVDCADEIADAPAWLIELVAPGNGVVAPTPPADWADLVAAGVAEGARDTTVTRLVGHLLQRHVDPFITLELMLAWNEARCRPPLPAKGVERIVGSIATRELAKKGRRDG